MDMESGYRVEGAGYRDGTACNPGCGVKALASNDLNLGQSIPLGLIDRAAEVEFDPGEETVQRIAGDSEAAEGSFSEDTCPAYDLAQRTTTPGLEAIVVAGILNGTVDDLGVRKRKNELPEIPGNGGPRGGRVPSESGFVIGVEHGRPDALLVQVFFRDDDDENASGFDEGPPLLDGDAGVVHVLETMRAVDTIERLSRKIASDLIGVALLHVKGLGVGDDKIGTAAYVEDGSTKIPVYVFRPSEEAGLGSFAHPVSGRGVAVNGTINTINVGLGRVNAGGLARGRLCPGRVRWGATSACRSTP
jgi:hypothetical protein